MRPCLFNVRGLLACGMGLIFCAGMAHAGTKTWNGIGGDGNWSNPANWGGNPPGGGEDLHFAGNTGLASNNDFTAGVSFSSITFDSGAGNFVLGGSALTLTGGAAAIANNTAAGTMTMNMGITFSSASTIACAPSATLTVGGAIDNGGFTLAVNSAGTTNLNGAITGQGGLTMSGPGTLTLSNTANTYTGQTAINAGTVSVSALANGGSNSSLGAAPASTAILLGSASAARLSYTGGTASTDRQVLVQGSNGGTIQATHGSATLTLSGTIDISGNPIAFDTSPGNMTVLSVISGAGAVTKTGTGTLTLSGNNTYSGGTTLSGGTLNINSPSAISTGVLTIGGAATIDNTSGGAISLKSNNNAQNWNADFTFVGTNDLDLGTGAVTASGSRQVTVTGGTLTVGGAIGGSVVALTKAGSGTLRLSGANSYGGDTTISGGTLALGADNVLPGGTSAGNVIVNGALDVAGHNNTINGLSGTGTVDSSVAQLPFTLTVGNNNATSTFSGVIKNTAGTLALVKTGGGALTLSGASTFSGGVTLSAGTLNVNSPTAIGTGALTIGGTATMDNTSGGAISLNNNNAQNWNADFTFVGTNDLDVGTGAVAMSGSRQVTVTGGTLTVGGVIGGGAVGLTKAGGGTLTLSGSNNYAGTTTVAAGVLLVNGTQEGSAVALNAGTLGGSGTVGGISVPAAATPAAARAVGGRATSATQKISPGSALTQIARLTCNGNVTLGANTTYEVQLDGTGPTADLLQNNAGGINYNLNDATLNVTAASNSTAQTYTIISVIGPTSNLNGMFAGLPHGQTFNSAGRLFQISYTTSGNPKTVKLMDVTTLLPAITSPTAAAGSVGVAFSYTIAATNNPTSFNATNLPAWASVNTSTGAITGTPDAAASTNVTISATNSSGTGSATLAITTAVGPAITSVNATDNPISPGDTTTLAAQATNPNNGPLSFTWSFGDGTAAGTTNPVDHTFAAAGQYTVSVTASDGTYTSQPAPYVITVEAPNSGGQGVHNAAEGTAPVANPLNGLALSVTKSDGGVVELFVDVEALNRAAFAVSTNFNGVAAQLNAVPIQGVHPVQKFMDASVFVATSTAFDAGTTNPRGKARRMLAVSNREVGLPVQYTQDPGSQAISFKRINGKFGFSAARKARADTVTVSTLVELPVGLKVTDEQDMAVGVGNVLDHVKLDSKGKGKTAGDNSSLRKVRVKYPKVDKTTKLTAGTSDKRIARIDITLSAKDLVAKGFDTEGVDPKSNGKQLSIQAAFVLAGVAYQNQVPVKFKVTPKQDSGSILISH